MATAGVRGVSINDEAIGNHGPWVALITGGPKPPPMGISEAQLRAFKVPAIVIPGNHKTHAAASSLSAQKLIPGCELFELPITDRDVALIPFTDWAEHQPAIAAACVDFMRRVDTLGAKTLRAAATVGT